MDANQRISDLEAILGEYMAQNALAQRRFEAESKLFREEMLAFKEEIRRDTQTFKEEIRRDTQALKEEMLAFKEEIRQDTKALKEEMLAFKEEIRRDTQALKEEMLAFKEEIRRDTQAFKEEMLAFKEEIRRDTQVLKEEMLAFKEEIRRDTQVLKEEMLAFKEEIRRDTQAFKEEMLAFKEEIRQDTKALKEEMQTFKVRVEDSIKENNKQWGGLANKLGTIVEDLIFPASRPVIESVFNITLQQLSMRVVRRNNELKEEFDVIALSDEQVFLIEVKSTPRIDYLTDFVDRKIAVFRQLFPEYAAMRLVPIFASISIPDDFVRMATNRKVFVMAYREWEYMDILNAKELLLQS